MQKSRVLRGRLGVCQSVETGDAETERVAPLAAVHVITQSQNDLQELFELFTARHFFGSLQDGRDFGFHFADALSKFLLIEQSVEPLFVVADPGTSSKHQTKVH